MVLHSAFCDLPEENLCVSHNIVIAVKQIKMRWVGHIARVQETNVYNILDGKKGKHGGLKRYWLGNIKTNLPPLYNFGTNSVVKRPTRKRHTSYRYKV
jgi:hypothetical protein